MTSPASAPQQAAVATGAGDDADDQAERYEEREAQSTELEQFRGGDRIVIGVSGSVLVLILLILLIV